MRWGAEDYSEWEAKRRRWRRRQRLFMKFALVAVFLATFAMAWKYLPPSVNLGLLRTEADRIREQSVYYPNCAAAWRDGKAPIREGEPGYRPELDGDDDGIACEPIPLRRRIW